jgi:hypothetical protein
MSVNRKSFAMNSKVSFFNSFPEFIKKLITLTYIPFRSIAESVYSVIYGRLNICRDGNLRIIYLTGFPRTGTSAMKYYFGAYPGLKIQSFDPSGFFVSWKKATRFRTSDILVDKSNHYIKSPGKIFKACRDQAALCCIVRDPRDSLLSLFTFPEAREVPRGSKFWLYWHYNYNNFLEYAENSPYGSRIYFLRYEDFVRHPCRAKADYLTWLGLDTATKQIDNTYCLPETREFVLDKVHMWKEINTTSLQRWKGLDILDKRNILLQGWQNYPQVEELMTRLGYGKKGLERPKIHPKNFRMFMPDL